MERVSIFVDGSNFYHGLKSSRSPTKFDFHKFAVTLCGNDRKLVRLYYYNVPRDRQADPQKYKDQQRFFERLHHTPYLEMKLGRLERRGETYVEKGVDILIATDMINYAYKDAYDTAILVTGDGDFVSAVLAVKDAGKHVENVYFKRGRSRHLLKACDTFRELTPKFIRSCI